MNDIAPPHPICEARILPSPKEGKQRASISASPMGKARPTPSEILKETRDFEHEAKNWTNPSGRLLKNQVF